MCLPGTAQAVESVWAYPGYTGRMIYRPDAQGDRISDYSIVGYKQGKAAIPTVATNVLTITDDGTSDDTARIQAAINQVAALPLGSDGFRGVVLLQSGNYDISGQLNINASGVILRGAGTGDSGTILHARGTDTRALINVSGSGSRSLTGSTYNLIDKTVPAGTNSFRVSSTAGLAVGDSIYLTRPSPANWIHDIGMDQLLNDGTNDYRWTAGSKNQNWERTITRIEGNRVFIDSPVTESLQQVYGGGSFRKYTYSGRIENVGVENLRGESDYASDTDEAHSWDFIKVTKALNSWVRNTEARYFAYAAVNINTDSKWVTATNNVSKLPKSVLTGGRRYTYNIDNSQQNLVANSTADHGRHDFVLGSTVPGPNVFYNCTATNVHADAGPHHRYSTGTLFDNITTNGEINVQNRWNSGSGHGWAGANMVIWNSAAAGYTMQEIITLDNATIAKNWIVGSTGSIRNPDFSMPSGVTFPTIPQANDARYSPKYADSMGTNVATDSLYMAQLADATGQTDINYQWAGGSGNWADINKWVQSAVPNVRAIQMRDYLIGDIDNFTYDANPDDDYYIDPAFTALVQGQFGANIGGFDVVAANRNLAFTQQYALDANEQVVNAALALAIRSASGSSSNDKLMIDGAGTFTLDSLGWIRAVGTTTVGMFDLGPYLGAMQSGNLSIAFNGNAAADWGLLALQVAVDSPDAQVTISGGTITVNSAVPAVKSITVNGVNTILDITSGGQLTVNDVTCQGWLRVNGGVMSINGIMDNNSRVSILGGILRAVSSTALGSDGTVGTAVNGGTLDVNGQDLSTEPIAVQGSGAGGIGAIINSGPQQTNALRLVTLTGDVTFGGGSSPPGGAGLGRWDIRGTGASLSTGGNAYNLTKVGLNQVSLVSTTVDAALGDIYIQQGFLGFQSGANSMGNPNKTITIEAGAALEFYNTSNVMNKKCVLNGGAIWGESNTSNSQNRFSGPITINSAGGIFDAGGGLTGAAPKPSAVLTISGPITGVGGLTKNGPGTVFITGTPGYDGDTNITEGTLQINTGAAVTMHAINGAGTLGIDNATHLTATSIDVGTLKIGAGSKVAIAPMPGGPLADGYITVSVPEPATLQLLGTVLLAILASRIIARHKRRHI